MSDIFARRDPPDVGTLDRRTYLGSSDVAAILGLSPWRTPLDVYFEKIGKARPIDAAKEKLFRRGKRMEPVILDMLAEERELFIATRGARYRDPEHEWMAAEIDAETPGDTGMVNIEAKSVHPFAAGQFGEEGTDEIPIYYAAQAMYGLMVTGRQRCIFAVLVGSDNLSVYELERDEETIAGIRSKAVTFWRGHVLARVPPEPIVLEDVLRLMRRDIDVIAQAPTEVAKHIAEMKAMREKERAAHDRAEELKYQIGKWLLGAGAIENPTRKPKHIIMSESGATLMTIAYQEQQRIDSDTLRKKHPAIAAECSKTTSFFRFDTPKGKR